MRTTKKAMGALVTFVIATPAFHWVLGESAVRFEMLSTGAASRGELANDFGLGLLGLFIVVPGSLIGAAVAGWGVWRKLSARGAHK